MYIDKDLMLSDSQAVTVTAASTEKIDNSAAGDAVDMENYLVVQCREAATAAGAATVVIAIETDGDSAFGSPKTLLETAPLALADMTINKTLLKVRLPLGMERYLRVKYTVATGPLTAGKFDAFIVKNVEVRH